MGYSEVGYGGIGYNEVGHVGVGYSEVGHGGVGYSERDMSEWDIVKWDMDESCVCVAGFSTCGCQKKSVVYETECRHVAVQRGKQVQNHL